MNLFVYGTLQIDRLMSVVAGGGELRSAPATLKDHSVSTLPGHVVPMIGTLKGATAKGRVFFDLSSQQTARLDLFEGAFGYTRTSLKVESGEDAYTADVYLPPDLPKVQEGIWSLEDWAKDHLNPMLYAVEELFSHQPLPKQTSLRRMWPVIEKRAWARHSAILDGPQPSSLRYSAKKKDIELEGADAPLGNFFRLQSFRVNHKKFNGQRSETFHREVFIGVDAALLLPYDPLTGNVLLVEQARMGPFRRGDANPWQLEPIAGMMDARETPEVTAVREAKEEANIDVERLDRMFAMYPSPGDSTDHLTCFCASCSLPEEISYLGGLEEESEDLRIHIIRLKAALYMIETGEINSGPLISMLYWLDRNKQRYTTTA